MSCNTYKRLICLFIVNIVLNKCENYDMRIKNAIQCIEMKENAIPETNDSLRKSTDISDTSYDLIQTGDIYESFRQLKDIKDVNTGETIEGNSYLFTLVDKVEKGSFPLTLTQENLNTANLLSYKSYDLQKITTVDEKYILTRNFAKGNFGEVWFARGRLKKAVGFLDPIEEDFVLKRVFCEKGINHRESGKREIYFGRKLQTLSSPKMARFVESFQNPNSQSLWLVFRNEGKSLDKFLYEQNFNVYQSSQYWHNLRTTAVGKSLRKEIMKQILEALEVLLKSSIIHRDIKPSNIFLSILTSGQLNVKLGDFGSAIDLTYDLYAPLKPTNFEETVLYQPPEARISSTDSFPYFSTETLGYVTQTGRYDVYHAFDIWSAGIVFFEMYVGTINIFTLTDKIRKNVEVRLRKQYGSNLHSLSNEEKDGAYFEAILEEYGISKLNASKSKLRKLFESLNLIKSDEVSEEELDLIYHMLQYKPESRWNATRLLQHSYFD